MPGARGYLAGVLPVFATPLWKSLHANRHLPVRLPSSRPASQWLCAWCARCPRILGWCAAYLCHTPLESAAHSHLPVRLLSSRPALQWLLAWRARCPGILTWCASCLCYHYCCALTLRCPRIYESNCAQLPTQLGNRRACSSYFILRASRHQEAYVQCRC
jgi:hypothetical protein